jgi:uncharacterized iron-regulated membrane protein
MVYYRQLADDAVVARHDGGNHCGTGGLRRSPWIIRVTGSQLGFVQRTLKGHSAIGLLSGALMYLLILSGTLAVFDDELHRWEQPRATELEMLAPDAVQTAVRSSVGRTKEASPAIVVHLPSSASPRATLSDAAGLSYLDAFGHPQGAVRAPWSDFVMALHFYLNLPEIWGLALVGALGVMLVGLSITGVFALPRIFRDAFRLNPRAGRQLARIDWHNRLSVWTLPFGIAVAFTGAVLGVMTPGAVVMSSLHLASSEAAVFAPIFGSQPGPGRAAGPLPNAAAALRFMHKQFPRAVPTDVIVRNGGTAAGDIEVLANEPQRLIVGEYYLFDDKGRFRQPVGLSEGHIGQQFAASMYKLHFGNFAGLPMKLAYFVFGLALTVVSGTGVSIWLMKRRRRGLGLPRIERLWSMIIWGSPLLLALAYCLTWVGASQEVLTSFFWIGLAGALLAVSFIEVDAARLGRANRILLAAALFIICLRHVAITDWSRTGIVSIDFALALSAVVLVLASIELRRRPVVHSQQPAPNNNSHVPAGRTI